MCLLAISVKNTLPEVVKYAKIAQNSGFLGTYRFGVSVRPSVRLSICLSVILFCTG